MRGWHIFFASFPFCCLTERINAHSYFPQFGLFHPKEAYIYFLSQNYYMAFLDVVCKMNLNLF